MHIFLPFLPGPREVRSLPVAVTGEAPGKDNEDMITNWCLVPGAELFAARASRGVVWTTALGVARTTARLWYQRAKASGTAKRAGKGRRAPAKPRGVDVLAAALAVFEGKQGKESVL